jgi:CheY-like chemotaxis protein
MPKVLLIDDDPHLRTILSRVLKRNDFDVVIAEDGATGLRVAKRQRPDLIVLDIIMPGMDGFEVAQRLQSDPISARIPIMVLTAYATPYGRKMAVEVGIDDFTTKPFNIDDIVTKAKALTTTPRTSPNEPTVPLKSAGSARFISVHSLRGGLGCTSLAVNVATALKNLWLWPTLLLDADYAGGQVAMALNWPGGLSWTDLMQASMDNTVHRLLDDKRIAHDDGLHVLTSPADPRQADRISPQVVGTSLKMIQQRYDYIVADLAHDLRENTLEVLKNSDKILHLLSPDAMSLQLAKKALAAYQARGIQHEDVLLVLVDTRPGKMAKASDVELAVGQPLAAYIPYAPEMTESINRGTSFIEFRPDHKLTRLLEDLAFLLSKPAHRNGEPSMPTPTYSRAHARASSAAKNGSLSDRSRYLLKQAGLER